MPVPGIGAYVKQKKGDFTSRSPCFLIIRGIRENEKQEPAFDFQFLAKMEGITSSQLLQYFGNQGLFFSVNGEKVLETLERLRAEAPSEWKQLLGLEVVPSWKDWLGQHFLNILGPISNNEYENKVAQIFNALGFEVEQMGYKREGECPDGIIYGKDFAIVYDCKNRTDYLLDAPDKRAMIRYVQVAKRRVREREAIEKVYFAYVAHSYHQNTKNLGDIEKQAGTKGMLLTSETSLYLFYKKLRAGKSFLLADFEELAIGVVVRQEDVERVYSG